MVTGIALSNVHSAVPRVGDVGEARIKRCSQALHKIGKGIREVAIFTFTEAMARHVHSAAEGTLFSVERSNVAAFRL